jgi:hypothetical protein
LQLVIIEVEREGILACQFKAYIVHRPVSISDTLDPVFYDDRKYDTEVNALLGLEKELWKDDVRVMKWQDGVEEGNISELEREELRLRKQIRDAEDPATRR